MDTDLIRVFMGLKVFTPPHMKGGHLEVRILKMMVIILSRNLEIFDSNGIILDHFIGNSCVELCYN